MELTDDRNRLLDEHGVLMRAHAQAQARCSELLSVQAERMRQMDAQLMRARAIALRCLSALAWEREDRAALEQSMPGLKRRAAMGRQVADLQARVRALMHELHRRELARDKVVDDDQAALRPGQALPAGLEAGLEAGLQASLEAADLVICQTGCMSHGDYWRVHDHCKRTGKLCVLVDQPDGLQIMRIHRA